MKTAEEKEPKRVHKIKNAGGTEIPVNSFHLDGAVEIRATILANGKRVDVHLFDAEELADITIGDLIEAARKKITCPECKGKDDDCEKCAGDGEVDKHSDGARIEIGPANVSDLN